MHYVIFENDNKIAFSRALDMKIRGKDAYLYLISLPQKDYSQLIIACSDEDYDALKEYDDLGKLFSGEERIINIFLNEFKDNIAIDGADSLDEYSSLADSFLLEWEVPIVKIQYFKKRRSSFGDSVG